MEWFWWKPRQYLYFLSLVVKISANRVAFSTAKNRVIASFRVPTYIFEQVADERGIICRKSIVLLKLQKPTQNWISSPSSYIRSQSEKLSDKTFVIGFEIRYERKLEDVRSFSPHLRHWPSRRKTPSYFFNFSNLPTFVLLLVGTRIVIFINIHYSFSCFRFFFSFVR